MPNRNTQRIIGWLAFAGVLVSCFGCGLLWQNQVTAAIIAFVAADIILIPLIGFLGMTRKRLKRVVRQQEVQQEIVKDEQLDALAGVGEEIQNPKSGRPLGHQNHEP